MKFVFGLWFDEARHVKFGTGIIKIPTSPVQNTVYKSININMVMVQNFEVISQGLLGCDIT
jgi:hypothetical protein